MHHNEPARRRHTPEVPIVGRPPSARYGHTPRGAEPSTPRPPYVTPEFQPRAPQPGWEAGSRPPRRGDDGDEAGGRRRAIEQRTDTRLATIVAALASLAAGIIHIGATPGHWDEWRTAGLFFAGTAAFQILWALLIVTVGGRFLAVVGVLGNLGVIATWAVSRQWGVPFGPHADVPEAVGLADTLSTLLAGLVAAVMLWSLLPRETHGVLSAGGYRLAVIGAVLVMATAAVPGTVNALDPNHSHAGDDGHEHGGDEGDDHHHGDDADMDDGATDAEPDESAPEESTEPEPTHNDDGHDHTH